MSTKKKRRATFIPANNDKTTAKLALQSAGHYCWHAAVLADPLSFPPERLGHVLTVMRTETR